MEVSRVAHVPTQRGPLRRALDPEVVDQRPKGPVARPSCDHDPVRAGAGILVGSRLVHPLIVGCPTGGSRHLGTISPG